MKQILFLIYFFSLCSYSYSHSVSFLPPPPYPALSPPRVNPICYSCPRVVRKCPRLIRPLSSTLSPPQPDNTFNYQEYPTHFTRKDAECYGRHVFAKITLSDVSKESGLDLASLLSSSSSPKYI